MNTSFDCLLPALDGAPCKRLVPVPSGPLCRNWPLSKVGDLEPQKMLELWVGLCCVSSSSRSILCGSKKYYQDGSSMIYTTVIPSILSFSIYFGMPKIWAAGGRWPAILRTFGSLWTATASADNFCCSDLRWFIVLYTNKQHANDSMMNPEETSPYTHKYIYIYLYSNYF